MTATNAIPFADVSFDPAVVPVVDQPFLDEVVRRILAVASPLKIVLFGSQARGQARLDSDLDLLIVESHSTLPRHQRATPYYMALSGLHPSKDIVVYTPDEIAEWSNVPQAFPTTAIGEGKVLYEKQG
jgi:predicted nucleotidyltransferase